MHVQTRLLKRKSVYYFRAKIPRDLQPFLGKVEEKFSLRTRDPAEARRLARQASVDFDGRCQRLREEIRSRQGRKEPLVIDDDLIRELCDLWRHHALSADEYHRREGIFRHERNARRAEARATDKVLKAALADARLEVIEPALVLFLQLLGIELRGSDSRYRELLYRFLQTVTEVHGQQMARDAGEVVWTPPPPAGCRTARYVSGGVSLDELFEDWKRFDPGRPERTLKDVHATLRDFESVVGTKTAEAIERSDVIRYRDELIGRGLRPKTVNKKVTFLCAIFNVGINNGKLERNPAQRIPTPKDEGRHRLPFDSDDLRKIFGSPIYTEGRTLGRHVGAASQWIPLMALYQGCRIEELAQLLVADVQKVDGFWCLVVDDHPGDGGERKRLKNAASRRRLPLHPKVIDAGFLRYVEQIKGAGHTRLFPALRPDRFGKFSSGFSKAFMRFIREKLAITDRRKVFHSFRHTFRDACREAGLDEEIADALMGHAGGGRMGRRYGSSFSVRRLQAAVRQIEYPGVYIPAFYALRDGDAGASRRTPVEGP